MVNGSAILTQRTRCFNLFQRMRYSTSNSLGGANSRPATCHLRKKPATSFNQTQGSVELVIPELQQMDSTHFLRYGRFLYPTSQFAKQECIRHASDGQIACRLMERNNNLRSLLV